MAAGTQKGEPLSGHSSYGTCVSFSPDGKTLASGSSDTTIILWDLTIGDLFLTSNNKPTPLFLAFAGGVEFFWGKRVKDLGFVSTRTPNLYGQDGYPFTFDPKYRPLLNPPAPGQDKFDQILEWAKNQTGE